MKTKKTSKKADKKVVAIIGPPKAGKTDATKIFEKEGFCRLDAHDKVEDFVKTLFGGEITEENRESLIDSTKKRGCSVHRAYWLNLVLSSVPEDEECVVLDNFTLPELYGADITVFMIDRVDPSELTEEDSEESDTSEASENYKMILNAGDVESFHDSVREIATEIKSNHLQQK